MLAFDEILAEVEKEVQAENAIRDGLGRAGTRALDIKILGQLSLILNKEASSKLILQMTMDIDVLFDGDTFVEKVFRQAANKKGLLIDDLSKEIWLPTDHTFENYYQSDCLTVSFLDPQSALVSKAIKAPEKNLFLIRQALSVYGKTLTEKILKYGGNPIFFNNAKKNKL